MPGAGNAFASWSIVVSWIYPGGASISSMLTLISATGSGVSNVLLVDMNELTASAYFASNLLKSVNRERGYYLLPSPSLFGIGLGFAKLFAKSPVNFFAPSLSIGTIVIPFAFTLANILF